MEKKQPKIAKTYRLLPETIQDIQDIKESFKKNRYEFSSDAQVIQYAVGQTKTFVEEVDKDVVHHQFDKEEIQRLILWYGIFAADGFATEQDEKMAQWLLDSIQ